MAEQLSGRGLWAELSERKGILEKLSGDRPGRVRIRGRLTLYSEGSGEPSKGRMCWCCTVMLGG